MNTSGHVDGLLSVFLNWQALLISFGVFILLGVVRNIGINKDKDGKVTGGFALHHMFQRFLPTYPYVIAILFCLLPKSPLPELVTTSFSGRLLYGLYTGWLSGFSYQLLKSLLNKAGAQIPEENKP
jgi:hypothetical protein